jgi:hypothetical protein
MAWGDYVEKELISKRFLISVMVLAGYLSGQVPESIALVIIAFYFGSTVAKNQSIEVVQG